MRRERFVITDDNWFLIEPLLPETKRDCGVTAKDNRLIHIAHDKRPTNDATPPEGAGVL